VNGQVRVLLVDDHTLVRAGLRRLLETHAGIRVAAEAASGDEALAALDRERVDVAVLDLTMPGMDGLSLLAEIRERFPTVRAIVLTMHAEGAYVARAIRAGAMSYLLKDSAAQDLIAAIEAVMRGEAYYSPAVQQLLAGAMQDPGAARGIEGLTERERQVLALVAEGLPTKQIAAELEISARTVETHRANIMRKLDARSVAMLTRIAIREGLGRRK
jgi:DNA-binding NarL/FixJ family response regulator